MKIAAAQILPVKGDISKNIEQHIEFVKLAADHEADLLIFPELSLTGYEPRLAKELATTADDPRLDVFQDLADRKKIIIGMGLPAIAQNGIQISMVFFTPNVSRRIYSKQYLHQDELPYFVSESKSLLIEIETFKLVPAICYESFLPEHNQAAKNAGAAVYLSSVSKPSKGIDHAQSYFSKLAKQYSMTILMANNVGPSDNFFAAGGSAVWNNQGVLKGQLNDQEEGLLVFDVLTENTWTLLKNAH